MEWMLDNDFWMTEQITHEGLMIETMAYDQA